MNKIKMKCQNVKHYRHLFQIFLLTLFILYCDGCFQSLALIDDGIVTIGLYADSGAAQSCVTAAKNMFEWMGYTVELLDANTINYGDILHIDIFYFPGGTSRPYIIDITEEGKNKIRQMLYAGRGYIGTCAGGMFAAEIQIWRGTTYSEGQLGIFPGTAEGPIEELFGYPGIGMCQVNLVKDHPITEGQPDSVWILYYNGPFFDPKFTADVEIIGVYDITGQPALVAFEYGRGRVFLTGPHPEWEEDSDRDSVWYFDNFSDYGSDWPLMQNATRWCLQETGE